MGAGWSDGFRQTFGCLQTASAVWLRQIVLALATLIVAPCATANMPRLAVYAHYRALFLLAESGSDVEFKARRKSID